MQSLKLLLIGSLFISGCVAPILVVAGAVTGYSLSNDSATGNVKSDYRVLWDVCLDRLQSMEAEVLVVNESRGLIKSRISGHSVTVRINTVTTDNQRLRISARRNYLPKPQFAQKVFLKIIEDL